MPKKKTSKKIKKIIEKYIETLKEDGLLIKQVFLFGSSARGIAKIGNDIDIAVISPEFGKNRTKEGQYLFKKAWPVDSRIEPHPFHPKNFIDEDPLVWEIKEKGIRVL